MIRVPKAHTSRKWLPIDTSFVYGKRKEDLENNIDDEEIQECFCQSAEMDFRRLAGLRNLNVDLKYDVLCLYLKV